LAGKGRRRMMMRMSGTGVVSGERLAARAHRAGCRRGHQRRGRDAARRRGEARPAAPLLDTVAVGEGGHGGPRKGGFGGGGEAEDEEGKKGRRTLFARSRVVLRLWPESLEEANGVCGEKT
jgi:hypothetical protein